MSKDSRMNERGSEMRVDALGKESTRVTFSSGGFLLRDLAFFKVGAITFDTRRTLVGCEDDACNFGTVSNDEFSRFKFVDVDSVDNVGLTSFSTC